MGNISFILSFSICLKAQIWLSEILSKFLSIMNDSTNISAGVIESSINHDKLRHRIRVHAKLMIHTHKLSFLDCKVIITCILNTVSYCLGSRFSLVVEHSWVLVLSFLLYQIAFVLLQSVDSTLNLEDNASHSSTSSKITPRQSKGKAKVFRKSKDKSGEWKPDEPGGSGPYPMTNSASTQNALVFESSASVNGAKHQNASKLLYKSPTNSIKKGHSREVMNQSGRKWQLNEPGDSGPILGAPFGSLIDMNDFVGLTQLENSAPKEHDTRESCGGVKILHTDEKETTEEHTIKAENMELLDACAITESRDIYDDLDVPGCDRTSPESIPNTVVPTIRRTSSVDHQIVIKPVVGSKSSRNRFFSDPQEVYGRDEKSRLDYRNNAGSAVPQPRKAKNKLSGLTTNSMRSNRSPLYKSVKAAHQKSGVISQKRAESGAGNPLRYVSSSSIGSRSIKSFRSNRWKHPLASPSGPASPVSNRSLRMHPARFNMNRDNDGSMSNVSFIVPEALITQLFGEDFEAEARQHLSHFLAECGLQDENEDKRQSHAHKIDSNNEPEEEAKLKISRSVLSNSDHPDYFPPSPRVSQEGNVVVSSSLARAIIDGSGSPEHSIDENEILSHRSHCLSG